MRIKLFFAFAILAVNTGCFSIMIRKDGSESGSYWTKTTQQSEEAAKIDGDLNFEKSLEHCRLKSTKYVQRRCYSNLFKNNVDKSVCKELSLNPIAHYTCYFEIIKDKRLKRADLKSFCPDMMCLSVYAYRHYGTDGAEPELLPYREQARKIENETSYQVPPASAMAPSQGFEFYEVLHGEGRTNRAFGVGYDLNFKYNGSEIPSIGIGYYNLAEKIYTIDLVISGVQKPAAARLALGAQFKDNYDTRYHLLYALGVGAKSLGAGPLLEISSDFKKDHQAVIGIMLLFQMPRKN